MRVMGHADPIVRPRPACPECVSKDATIAELTRLLTLANNVSNAPANSANIAANKVLTEEPVSRAANGDRKAYMRELMRRKRAEAKR